MLHLQHGLIDSIANICWFIKNWISTDIQCYIIIKSKSRNCLEMSIIFGLGSKTWGRGRLQASPSIPFSYSFQNISYFKTDNIFHLSHPPFFKFSFDIPPCFTFQSWVPESIFVDSRFV